VSPRKTARAAPVTCPRKAGLISHSRLAMTQEIYTHKDRQAQHDAPTKISKTRTMTTDGTMNSGQWVSTVGVNRHLSILAGGVLPGGAKETRTPDPLLAKAATTPARPAVTQVMVLSLVP
jgi:hypothetical protein